VKTLLRISIILLAALAVTGATYVVSQSTWATAQLAAPGGGEGGEGRPERGTPPDFSANLASAAATLGVTTEALSEALGGMPPDFAQAAQSLGLAEADVQAAVEASLAASGFGGGGEGGERGGGFNAAALSTFTRILLPMALMIGGVVLIQLVVERVKQRRTRALPGAQGG
jgi:hypothetical protein